MNLLRVSVDGVEPGVRLGEDVHSANGILLAKKDQVVDLRLIQIFKSFGLADIAIIPGSEVSKVQEPVTTRPEVLEAVRKRFKNLNLKVPVIQGLFDFCVARSSNSMYEPSGGTKEVS